MEHSVFLREFAEKLWAIASEKGYQYVLVDGDLKKGKWRTMPNGLHVFIVDGKIEAGPQSVIGKSPDELDWDEVADEEKNNTTETLPRKEVMHKYLEALMQAKKSKNIDTRDRAVDKIMSQMAAEDEFHVIFLRTGNKPSPLLKELAKDFAEYGKFPSDGTRAEQVTFFNDRLSLLNRLTKILPAEGKKDIHPHIEHIEEMLEQYKNKEEDKPDKVRHHETGPNILPLAIVKIQAAIKALVLSAVSMVVEFISEGASNSGNERLYSFTKDILSTINTSKRENFDQLFEEELSHG